MQIRTFTETKKQWRLVRPCFVSYSKNRLFFMVINLLLIINTVCNCFVSRTNQVSHDAVRPRSTSDEFRSRVIIENCRLFQYGGIFQSYQQATWLNQTSTLLHALHVKNTSLSLDQGNFAKFRMAVSFTLIDLKFLDQQSQFSLTL